MKAAEKNLVGLFRALDDDRQRTLLAFAEFLAARSPPPAAASPEPQTIPRPAEESVVKAIRRLMATYPMLDRGNLLNETSSYMTRHVMQGKPAIEVIDELEIVFARHYERYQSGE